MRWPVTGIAVEPEPSPSWIGCSAQWSQTAGALRRIHNPADEVFLSPLAAITSAAAAAGEAGIAPRLVSQDSTGFAVAFIPDTRPAKLDDLQDQALLASALGLRERYHAQDVKLPERSLFEDVERLREAHRAAGIPVPPEADVLSRELERFAARRERFAARPLPCHGDGAVSNLLLARDGAQPPMLTGWSLAAWRDPVEEAGSVIGELVPFCATAPVVLSALGLPTEAELTARAWSVADDLFWGLIANWRMATAADHAVDYVKYGLWRLTRGRAAQHTCAELGAWLKDPK